MLVFIYITAADIPLQREFLDDTHFDAAAEKSISLPWNY
jgi:hypothetical protein